MDATPTRSAIFSSGRPLATPRPRLDLYACLAALTAMAAVLLWFGPRHAPWADEAQAWLIARDGSFWGIVSHWARDDGTPALWHVLLYGLIHAGLPYSALWTVSAACALLGAALILFAAPFPAWARIGSIFGFWILYQYGLVTRSYALDVFLMPAIAAVFPARARRPLLFGLLVGLLANTNLYGLALGAVLGLQWLWDTLAHRAWRGDRVAGQAAGICLCAALGVASVAQSWPDASVATCCDIGLSPKAAPQLLLRALFDRGLAPAPLEAWATRIRLALCLATLAPMLWLAARAGRLWLFIGLLAAPMAVAGAIHANHHHAGLAYLALLVGLWISWEGWSSAETGLKVWLTASLAILLSAQAADTVSALRQEARVPYSGGRDMAAWLRLWRAAHPAARLAALDFQSLPVLPYYPQPIFANMPWKGGWYHWATPDAPSIHSTPAERDAVARQGWDAILISDEHKALGADGKPSGDTDVPAIDQAMAARGYVLAHASSGAQFVEAGHPSADGLRLYVRDSAR